MTGCRCRMLGGVPLVDDDKHTEALMNSSVDIIKASSSWDFGSDHPDDDANPGLREAKQEWRDRRLSRSDVQQRLSEACEIIEDGTADSDLRRARDMVQIWANQWPEDVTPRAMKRLAELMAGDSRLRSRASALTASG